MSTTKRKTTKPAEPSQPTASEITQPSSSHDWLFTFVTAALSSAVFAVGSYKLGKSEWRNAKHAQIPEHRSFGYSYTNNVPKDHILQTTDSGMFRCVTDDDLANESLARNLKTTFHRSGSKGLVYTESGITSITGFETRQEAIAAAWKHISWCADLSAIRAREEVYLRYAQGDTFKSLVNNEQMVSSLLVTSNGVLEAASKTARNSATNIVFSHPRGSYYITTTNIIFR